MNIKIIKALYKKEIKDILRDKKTILMMIVLPLILYPLIFIFSMSFATKAMTESTSKIFRIEMADFEGSDELQSFFKANQDKHSYTFAFYENDNLNGIEALSSNKIGAYIDGAVSDNGIMYFTVYYNASDSSSQTAASMVNTMLDDYSESLTVRMLEAENLDADRILNPISCSLNNVASSEKTVGNLFGTIVPFLLIASILMGAMYPAIDVTSGEKERGTLETLLTLPVKNIELITSKFLATSTLASCTAFLNVLSLGLIGSYLYSVVEITGEIDSVFNISLYIPAILITLVLAIIFAMFASAVCLSVCIFARTFKEAQNYTTPIMLVFMLSGLVSIMPSSGQTSKTILIPVVNFAILITDVFKLEYDIGIIMQVIMINLAYTMLAISFMTAAFSSENILFGDSSNGIRIIEKRSEMKAKSIPGIGDVILLFSVLLIMLFMVGSLFVLKYGIYGAIIQQLIFLILPLAYCWYIKTDFKKVFRFKVPSVGALLGGTVTWIGGYFIMQALSQIALRLAPETASEADESIQYIVNGVSPLLVIFAIAILPPICEEIAFRGFLFGTFSNRFKIWPAIILNGIIFGAYHANIIKLFIVGFLGAVMGYVIYKSESILVSMLMHFLNNFTSMMIFLNQDYLEAKMPILFTEEIGPSGVLAMLIGGIVVMAIGIVIVNKSATRKKKLD